MSRSVLVVDDDASVARLVGAVLAREGLTAELAPDGPSALELLRNGRFALVITDMTMPGMSGLELVRAAEGQGLRTPFLLMSAFLDVETERQIFAEPGIAGVLRKPFELTRLLDDVRAMLAAPHAAPAASVVAPHTDAGDSDARCANPVMPQLVMPTMTPVEPCLTLALVALRDFRPWPASAAGLRSVTAAAGPVRTLASLRWPLLPEVLSVDLRRRAGRRAAEAFGAGGVPAAAAHRSPC